MVYTIILYLALYVPEFACTTNESDSGRYDQLLYWQLVIFATYIHKGMRLPFLMI